VAPTRRNRDARACTRYVLMLGAFIHRGHAGANSFRFTGRLGRRRLRPGSYWLVARATDAFGNVSAPARAAFRILLRAGAT
jgi:hypothetical protein